MAVIARINGDRVLAECLPSDGVGSMVYVTGPISDGKYQVTSCDPNSFDKMPAVGMIIEKLSSTIVVVQLGGVVRSVYSGLTPGELLFVDDGGGLSDTPPEPTSGFPSKFMQNVGVAISDEIIRLNPNSMMAKRIYP